MKKRTFQASEASEILRRAAARHIDLIVVHCTATPAGRDVSVADIDRWHRARGWEGIGYHYVVLLDGSIAVGRDPDRVGAHCRGHNRTSIGVAYVGGLDASGRPTDTRTPAQQQALLQLLSVLKQTYPDAAIRGHRGFVAKACPCFDATSEYSAL